MIGVEGHEQSVVTTVVPKVVRMIFKRWETPQVDLFATKQNRKCHRFCSLHGLNGGSLSDALLSWAGNLMYAFPTIPLISRTILKIKRDRDKVVMITPAWPHQH